MPDRSWFATRCLLLALTLVAIDVRAQSTAPATSPASVPASVPPAAPDTQPATTPALPATVPAAVATQPAVVVPPPPIPIADINVKADPDAQIAKGIESESAADNIVPLIDEKLVELIRDVDARSAETSRLLRATPSLSDLRSLESEWKGLAEQLNEWKEDLAIRAKLLQDNASTLAGMSNNFWLPTLDSIRASREPPELIQQAESVVAALKQARETVEARRTKVLSVQSRVRETAVRVGNSQAAVANALAAARSRLLTRDNPAIWDWTGRGAVNADTQQTIETQWNAFRAYSLRRSMAFALQAGIWLLLIPVFFRIRRWARRWAVEDPSLQRSALAFESPVATATITALIFSGWLYPHAPRLLWTIVVALALAPTIIVVRRLLDRRLLPILFALGIFFTIDRCREVAATEPRIYQLLLLAEMVAGAGLLIWYIRSGRVRAAINYSETVEALIVLTCRAFAILFIVASLATALGYVGLGTLLGHAVLGSAYLAVILYAATRIIEGLVMAIVRTRPVALLQAINKNRRLVWVRTCRLVNWLALVAWVLGTLDMLTVREIFVDAVMSVLTATLSVGTFSLSLGQVVAFLLTVWASLLISKFIRFVLQEDVYPRFHMARGLPYAVSTMLHYIILLIGFTTAVQMLGYDMTKFTILAGAFGVGLGFGLQNIFNNFVSGLILLFERPIKVGDVIQIGGDTGSVRRIGIRASVIRLGSGAEIIMPNGRLISDPLTNWTLSGRGRDIELEIAVGGAAEPRQVIALWAKVTAVHPKVAEEPPPRATLLGLGGDAIKFELRAWTNEFESWSATRSDLAIAMNTALKDAGIVLK
ncbi:mechanosensitive ion channel family protein [Humisphaera borealis]|uniref:Mechanosensitive ion channel n=1 Tax=Humisphaera borealis TaxID=2807512 RepID=A0A7M2WV73_9BACT|nr:mechanosensitive ion channel domain-containing protein [Humisphaera borealis]QOV89457.1 mechanosensitive ion channel [Humisphaera borealis]